MIDPPISEPRLHQALLISHQHLAGLVEGIHRHQLLGALSKCISEFTSEQISFKRRHATWSVGLMASWMSLSEELRQPSPQTQDSKARGLWLASFQLWGMNMIRLWFFSMCLQVLASQRAACPQPWCTLSHQQPRCLHQRNNHILLLRLKLQGSQEPYS